MNNDQLMPYLQVFPAVAFIIILFLIVLIVQMEARFKHAVDLLKKERNRRAHLEMALEATEEAHEQTYKERFEEGFKAGELEQKAKVPIFPKQYLTDELMQINLMKRAAV